MPNPIIEISEHDERQWIGKSERRQPARLPMPFPQTKSEMDRNDPKEAQWRCDDRFESGARLSPGDRYIMSLKAYDWPACKEDVTVVTLGSNNHPSFGTMLSQAPGECIEGQGIAAPPRVDLLKRDDVRRMQLDVRDDATQIGPPQHRACTMDIPGHHPER